MPTIPLSRALNDPNLFAPHFRVRAGRGGRCFCAALFAEPPDEAGLAVYRERTGRTAWPTEPFTEAAVIVGRRGGKITDPGADCGLSGLLPRLCAVSGPGEVATIGVLAVDKGQARAIFRFVLGLLKAVPMLEPLIVRRDTETIELSNRVQIEIATAQPSLDARLLLCGGPVRRGRFLEKRRDLAQSRCRDFERVAAGPGDHPRLGVADRLVALFAAWRALQRLPQALRQGRRARPGVESLDAGDEPGHRPADHRRGLRGRSGNRPRRNMAAEFSTDLADYVSRETVEAVTMWGRHELPPEPGVTYSAFVDPAGGVSDSMTLAIGHLGRNNACILDAAARGCGRR